VPRNIEDGTVSIYINGLKDGTRYRESGLALVNEAATKEKVYLPGQRIFQIEL
jgi:hypothetical protein